MHEIRITYIRINGLQRGVGGGGGGGGVIQCKCAPLYIKGCINLPDLSIEFIFPASEAS